jgi:hypothetical protein
MYRKGGLGSADSVEQLRQAVSRELDQIEEESAAPAVLLMRFAPLRDEPKRIEGMLVYVPAPVTWSGQDMTQGLWQLRGGTWVLVG